MKAVWCVLQLAYSPTYTSSKYNRERERERERENRREEKTEKEDLLNVV